MATKPKDVHVDLLAIDMETGKYWLDPTEKHADRLEKIRKRNRDKWLAEQKRKTEAKAFDPGQHPREPAGSPTGGQFTSDGGGEGEAPSGDKQLLVSLNPRPEQVVHWAAQIGARQQELEKAGQTGGEEDTNLQKMSGALQSWANTSEADRNSGKFGISVVYNYPPENELAIKLQAAVVTQYNEATRVASLEFKGGIDHDALVKALKLTIDHYSETHRAERIEANSFADDAAEIKALEDAGFRKTGDGSGGVQTMIWGKKELTAGEKERLESMGREHSQKILGASQATARLLGYDPKLVSVNDSVYEFKIGGETTARHAAGLAHLDTGKIEIFPKELYSADSAVSVMAHEVAHQKYETVLKAVSAERTAVSADKEAIAAMKPDGTLLPPFDEKYPLYTRFEKHTGDALDKRIATDGVTEYSKAYWEQAKPGVENQVSIKTASHETIAEMARLMADTGKTGAAPAWRSYYRDIMKTYDELQAAKKAKA